MSSEPKAPGAPAPLSGLPLFYRAPEPLSAAVHGAWRLKDGDVSFAADTPFVPIVVGELAASARSYPIVFAAGNAQPIAVLGLERANLFVTNGAWAEDAYLPAYVRRYPFGFIATANPERFALAIDGASDRVVRTGGDGVALFDEDVKPSATTRQALAFCEVFQSEVAATTAFVEALKAQDLLIDRRADATLPDGRKLGLEGFQIVDARKFAGLADDVMLDWHRRGWLALVHFHLSSLDRFSALLTLQTARAAAPAPAKASKKPAKARAESAPADT
ncbi:SapC family protein [Brevundimonas sp.]|uniref:SapC family protein n=1 Tax=Brevundimonas sp. TaxID=1871086 RepID=UPI0025BD0EED|nr:SapC family protein [Brevundimonas sp.]